MTSYTVRPKTGTALDLKKHPHASLGISLGNSNEQGAKLQSIVLWLNKNFEHVTIDLSDTLYRWNLNGPDGVVLPNAEQLAREQGDRWLSENQNTFDKLQIPYEIVRWDNLIKHPEFDTYLDRFRLLYSNDETFQAAVESDVESFIRRKRKAAQEVSAIQSDNCRAFILEEASAHTILSRDHPYAAHVYPGDPLIAEEVLRRNKIVDAPQGMQGALFVSLRVERAASALPAVLRRGQERLIKPAA